MNKLVKEPSYNLIPERDLGKTPILECRRIGIDFGGLSAVDEFTIAIGRTEICGIIGPNGAGKTTIFNLLTNVYRPTRGSILVNGVDTLGMTTDEVNRRGVARTFQNIRLFKDLTVEENVLIGLHNSMNYSVASSMLRLPKYWKQEKEARERVRELLHIFHMENMTAQQAGSLPYGAQRRLEIVRSLATNPGILLLDEPTNHLDLDAIAWLEEFLINFENTVIVVSHDRYFLDKVVTKVIEIDAGQVRMYAGNYSAYAEKKAQLRDAQYKAYLNQQREIKHQEAVIVKLKSFNREKSIKRAESREKMLHKVQRIDKPVEVQSQMRLSLEPRVVSGNDVLTVEDLAKSFPQQKLFSNISFQIKRGERVALIGNNGTGKTTMLKILNGLLDADAGSFSLGAKVQIGYYDQEHHVLHMEKTVFEEISDDYPNLTNTEIRNLLAAFLFTGDDVFKPISALSGGERGRVSLAKLMLSEANFLILDEPTNHLDIISKEILEDALNNYEGTVLYVSHDRYFINRTATRILELTNHKLVNYIGNYDYYLEKKEELTSVYAPRFQEEKPMEKVSSTKQDWQQKKEEQARIRKRENDLKKTEKAIEDLESRDKEIDEELAKPEIATDPSKCIPLSTEKAEIAGKLEELYEKWEELAE